MTEMGDKAVAAIIITFILAMAFGYWVEKAYPATLTHNLTKQESWAGRDGGGKRMNFVKKVG